MTDHAATKTPTSPAPRAPRERGYALISLLAMMTLMMFAAMALAPSVRHQSLRELENEAIARGEQVAEAIRAFYHITQPNRLPTSMDELQEGAPFGTKKIQVLRASAARDPLSKSGEWRLIKAQDREFVEFVRAVTLYTNGRPPRDMTTDQRLKAAVNVPIALNILDLGEEEAPGGEITTATSNGPFIGVASRSQRESIIAYYGIERHDKWVFTPLFK